MNSQDRLNAGDEELLAHIRSVLHGEQGVQIESLLTCLGALAGYACQVSVRRTAAFITVKTAAGDTYLEEQQRRGIASLPLIPRIVTIIVLGIIAASGVIWRAERAAQRQAEREAREQRDRQWNESLRTLERTAQQAQAAENQRKAAEQQQKVAAPIEAEVEAPAAAPAEAPAPPPGFDNSNFETVRLPDGRVVTRLKAQP